ncbi:methyltransferase domain-containing protein [Streptomyces sp. NPDC005438]|uniref:protein-L-isoaspartate O-methyltransferase family protein n=1 Tax=Streptomyces sp. NPDC005438 TaxID=3156880 RepID=UPI0033A211A4
MTLAPDDPYAAVPVDRFHGVDGRAVRPCTPAEVTRRHLRMLDVRPGARVLEIGTGSGYSAALLAHLAGPTGEVTTVDDDPALAERAAGLFAAYGYRVRVHLGDGTGGYPDRAPYDRVLAGTTPAAVPDQWLRQLLPGGRMLTGVRLSPLPGSYAVATLSVDREHRPVDVTVHHGGYTPMTGVAPPGPARAATAPDEPDHTLATLAPTGDAPAFLHALRTEPHTEPAPVTGEEYPHWRNWLWGTRPEGLLQATLDQGAGVGVGLCYGASPHVAVLTDSCLVADRPASPALAVLRSLVDRWREEGAPRTHRLSVSLVRRREGWLPRVGAGGSEVAADGGDGGLP